MTRLAAFSALALSLSVVACSSEPNEREETEAEIGQVSQAICVGRLPCNVKVGGNLVFGGGGVLAPLDPAPPPPPPTFEFECPKKPEYPCGPVLKEMSPGVWECVNSCGTGGFGVARYNPCPSSTPRYTCTPYGVCKCY